MTRRLLLCAVFLAEVLAVYVVVTQRFATSGDDYSYMYQARLLAAGKIYAEDPVYDHDEPMHDCLATKCITDYYGHRFSKYPPGWPIFLAVGSMLGVAWLVNPLLGTLLVFLILTYVERQIGKEWVKTTWLLLTLCLFFSYYAASWRAHIATAVFIFAAFLSYEAAERCPRHARLWLFLAGTLLGYSSIIRYIDWVPLGVWIGVSLGRRRKVVDLVIFGVGFALLASGNLLYNLLLSGHALQTPTELYGALGLHDRLMISPIGLEMTGVRLATLLWVFPPTILLALFCRRYRSSSKVRMYLALFSMNLGIYFFYPASPGGPGPRYLLAYFPFLVLAVVDLYRWIRHEGTPGVRHLWTVGMVALAVSNLIFAGTMTYTIYRRRDLERTVQQAGPGKKIFLLKSGTYQTNTGDLTRNPPDLSAAENLYFVWCEQVTRDTLLQRFPGRQIFVYHYPGHLYPYVPGDSASLR